MRPCLKRRRLDASLGKTICVSFCFRFVIFSFNLFFFHFIRTKKKRIGGKNEGKGHSVARAPLFLPFPLFLSFLPLKMKIFIYILIPSCRGKCQPVFCQRPLSGERRFGSVHPLLHLSFVFFLYCHSIKSRRNLTISSLFTFLFISSSVCFLLSI